MYLKRVELVGFKSFAEKTALEFGPGITAVVGPNGAGKSNISDAIRWVLGEHSARELRGTHMADVIFAGSEGKKAMGYAQVTLVLDNTDGKLSLPFAEVAVTRRVDRAGEGEYFINHAPCRLKDILDLFLDTGIGKENYSVVGQGRIDEILLAKPEDRRAIFEEAAGIARYKARKKEAVRKLQDTEQNLLRVGDLVGELEGRLTDLAAQAERARRYQDLAGELSGLEVGLLARGLQQAGTELARWQGQAAALRARLQETDLGLQDAEGALEVARQLAGALEQEGAALQVRLVEATARLERLEGQVQLGRQQAAQAEGEGARLAQEAGALAARLAELQAELDGARTRAADATAALARAQGELAAAEAAQEQAQAELAQAASRTEAGRARSFALAQAAAEKRNLAMAEGRAREQARERLARLRREAAEAEAALAAATVALHGADGRLREGAATRAGLESQMAGSRSREEQGAQAMQAATDQMARLRERIEAVSARLGLLEDLKASGEGFLKGTRTVLQAREQMKAWSRGVLGAVAELIRTDPAHERAIETALGAGIQNIVTETDQDAKRCIEELKRTGGGRATFLPLNIIRGGTFRSEELAELRGVDGFVGCALDLCRFAERFRPALANLLGRIAVARDMEAALALGRKTGFRHRFVTLDGEVLAAGGALTGGSQEGRSAGLLAREREREELAAELPRRREELAGARTEFEAARTAREAAARERGALEQQSRELELALTAIQGERERHRLETVRWQQQLAAIGTEAAAVDQQVLSGEAACQALQAGAGALAAEQAALEQEMAGWQTQGQALQQRAAAAADAVTGARVRQAELGQEERSLQATVARLAGEVERLSAAAAERDRELGVVGERRTALAREVAAAEAGAREAARERDHLSARHQELQARRMEAQAEANNKEREIRSLRRAQTEAAAQLSHAEVEQARLAAERESLATRLQEQHDLTPAQVAGRELAEELLPLARSRVQELRDAIRELGPVNLGAIEEYRQSQERYAFLTRQRADLEEAKAALYRAIEELDRRIRQHFLEAFQTIRKEFQRVYQELFEGGKADLQLVDEEDLLETGVEIISAPPGKKLTPLTLLSGGERAMTAIALLFALLRVRPSPFVVLDEVEAALDEANVERVGRYLKEYSRDAQFICITHQRGTMEVADSLYGVTMEGTGVSQVVSVRFTDVQGRLAG